MLSVDQGRELFSSVQIDWLCRDGHTAFGLSHILPIDLVACMDDSPDYDSVQRNEGVCFISLERLTRLRCAGNNLPADNLLPLYQAHHQQAGQHPSAPRRVLLSLFPAPGMEAFAQQHGIHTVVPPAPLVTWLNHKRNFQTALKDLSLPALPGKWCSLADVTYAELFAGFGPSLVAQLPVGTGGSGTRFIESEADLLAAASQFGAATAWVASDLGRVSANINGLVLQNGVIASCPNLQLEGLAIAGVRRGVYCGNDFAAAQSLPSCLLDEMTRQTLAIGGWMAKHRFRGIFGLDFVLDLASLKAYAIDLNPRWQGSTSLLCLAEQEAGRLPLVAAGFACQLGLLSEQEVLLSASSFSQPLSAAQLCLRVPEPHWCRIHGTVPAGVYRRAPGAIVEGSPQFVGTGVRFTDLAAEQDFLITGGIPRPDTLLEPAAHALRLSSRQALIDGSTLEPQEWVAQVAKSLFSELLLTPEPPE
jgi:hypothetical protein